jgi:hypothetical protein
MRLLQRGTALACFLMEGTLREGTPGLREEFRVGIQSATMSKEQSKTYTFTRQNLYDLVWVRADAEPSKEIVDFRSRVRQSMWFA